LLFEGITLVTAGFPEFVFDIPLQWYSDHPLMDLISGLSHHLGDAGMIALYPPFLAAALGTSFTRPFGNRTLNITVAVLAVALAISTVVAYVQWQSMAPSAVLYLWVMVVFFYSLLASLNAWHTARPGLARTRAGLFAIAFGLRDLCWCFAYAASFWLIYTNNSQPIDTPLFWLLKFVYVLGTLLAVPLIAYGILSAHLFDIDLKIRWTIKQSTLAALIIAIIFLISEGASTFLSAELGTVAGLFGAAVVMFFLTPLQHFAERVAATAMPNTENTPEYLAFRKMRVYEAALVDALSEGGISAKERTLLIHLRESLGITAADAEAIERELMAEQSTTVPAAA